MNILKFWKMAILGCIFNINFGQTLAPGSFLCNTLRTKLHAWTESSITVEFMVKCIWQQNLPVGSYGTFKMLPGTLDFWCSEGKKMRPPSVTPKLRVREVFKSGFWNISSHPTSVPSFSQICWPQLLAPGTLSQTMTLKLPQKNLNQMPGKHPQVFQSLNYKFDAKKSTFPQSKAKNKWSTVALYFATLN